MRFDRFNFLKHAFGYYFKLSSLSKVSFSHPLFTLLLLLGVAYISYQHYNFVYSLFINYNSLHGLVCLYAYLLKDYVLMVSSLSMIIRPPMHSGPRCYEWNRDPDPSTLVVTNWKRHLLALLSEYVGAQSQLERTLLAHLHLFMELYGFYVHISKLVWTH